MKYGPTQPYPPTQVQPTSNVSINDVSRITCYMDTYQLDDWFYANLATHSTWDALSIFPQQFHVDQLTDCVPGHNPYILAELPFQNVHGTTYPPDLSIYNPCP